MNMASIGILFFIVTAMHISPGKADVFVKIQCKAVNVGQYGQQSLLDCVIQTLAGITDTKINVVTWKKGGKEPRLVFNNPSIKLEPGYSFAEKSWTERNLNVSLLITNTSLLDDGDYTCQVLTNRGVDSATTSLKVTAKYSTPTIKKIDTVTPSTETILKCDTFGGYPKGHLRWFDVDRQEWTNSATMVSKKTESGLFHLSSTLPLLPGSIFSKYTCAVFNASEGKEDEATIDITHSQGSRGREADNVSGLSSKVVAPVVVIGSLIVGLLLLLVVMRRRRSQQSRRQSAAPLMGVPTFETCNLDPDQGDQQEVKT